MEVARLFDTLVHNSKAQAIEWMEFLISIGRNPLKSPDSEK